MSTCMFRFAKLVEAMEEKEDLKEQGAILERAQRLREEGAEEVRKLNELILSAKCNAVLDNQVAEKERRLAEMAEADRHQEEELEEERRKAESMAAARDNGINKFYKEYRNQLQQQLDEVEAERLREREKKEQVIVKHRKNCECCPGHSPIVNHYSSMSFKFKIQVSQFVSNSQLCH